MGPSGNSGYQGVETFGISFEPDCGSLRCGPRQRHLTPKEVQVLMILERAGPGQLVRRQELLDGAWGEQDVGDEALTVVVSRLRHHFDCLGVSDEVIQTVPKAGYRFLAPRSSRFELRQTDLSIARTQRLAWTALALGGIALILAVIGLFPWP